MTRLALFILLFISFKLYATHYRAGEIIYKNIGYLKYEVTVITYTTDINVPPDRDTLSFSWGDGTSSNMLRINGPVGGSGIPQGEFVGNNIKKNVYGGATGNGIHTYPGPLPFYIISMNDPNRVANIINICGSVNVPFYVEDTLKIYDPTFIGNNSSPILLTPPIDYANVGEIFFHNPAAYDPDGDSLVFELVPPLRTEGFPVPCYEFPDQIAPGINNEITIDSRTGEIIWNSPQRIGIYNIAILITEYRGGIKMGTLLRDMQIIVDSRNNRPPVIAKINDTCIVAGSLLAFPVFASDPDALQSVTLSAYGGPLELSINPAVFTGGTGPGQYTGQFYWQTVCDHVRQQFYEVVFKAEDNYTPPGQQPIPLSYLETWIIEIVAPAPQNLSAAAQGNQINLSWDNPYTCDSFATKKFIGFSVWKRESSNPFVVDTCTPGLAGRGYTKIAQNLFQYNFTDNDVVKGRQYCYRILAEFAEKTSLGLFYNKVESLPSNEACSELKRDVPLIINVDVTETDAINGKIFIRWVKPIADNINLDTTQFPGPYRFELKRGDGFTLSNPVNVAVNNSSFISSYIDTFFTDSLLNTSDNPYSYRVDFFSNNGTVLVGSSEPSSSVYLSLAASDNRIDLSWQENTPWVNDTFFIYKKSPGDLNFNLIGFTGQRNYTDDSLTNDSTYCYYVRSAGSYTATNVTNQRLYNNSEQKCAEPVDTIAPCPPTLTVTNDCSGINQKETCAVNEGNFQNNLKWNNPNKTCADDVILYRIYFSPPEDSIFTMIDNTEPATDTTYIHVLSNSLAGCYYVTAVDSYFNESVPSKTVCVDNCPCYILPNVFTPNGDSKNDFYTPILPYRFIDRVDMKIFNRWGNLVFETNDPMINWNGKDQKSKKDVKEGVYYYTCKVYELRVDGIKESKDILSGYIHVIRGNGNTN
jgi:gliding motility-associated-like protein